MHALKYCVDMMPASIISHIISSPTQKGSPVLTKTQLLFFQCLRKYIFSTFGKRPRIISCSKLHGNCSKLPETGSNYLPLMPPLWLAQFPNYHSSFSIKALLGKSLLPSSLATWCFLVATPKPFCKQPVTPLHQTSLIQHDKETTHLKQKTIKLWRNLLEGLNFKAYYLEKYT